MGIVRLEIKSLTSPDVKIGVWRPQSPAEVYFYLEMEIGERDAEGTNLFGVGVATPEGLQARTGPVLVERSFLVFQKFSWPLVRETVDRIVRECQGDDWDESVMRLQRYFRWEYEDYR